MYRKMIYEGKITFIGAEEKVGKNEIPKLTFVLEEITDREYKGWVAVDLLKDKTELIKSYKVGDAVKVSLNVRCNEYNGKYYNSITARKVEPSDGSAAGWADGGDDLPF